MSTYFSPFTAFTFNPDLFYPTDSGPLYLDSQATSVFPYTPNASGLPSSRVLTLPSDYGAVSLDQLFSSPLNLAASVTPSNQLQPIVDWDNFNWDRDWDSMTDDEILQAFGYGNGSNAGQPGAGSTPPPTSFSSSPSPSPFLPSYTSYSSPYTPPFDISAYVNPQYSTFGRPSDPFWQVYRPENMDDALAQAYMSSMAWLHGIDQSLFNKIIQDERLTNTALADLFGAKGYYDYLNGQPSYGSPSWTGTGAQWNDIVQQDLIQRGLMTPEEFQSIYSMPQWERDQILGSPYSAFDLIRPEFAPLSNNVTSTRDRLNDATEYFIDRARDAIDPARLRLRDDYATDQFAFLNSGYDDFGRINDPARLGLSDEFRRNYNFGPQDIEALKEQAARVVAARQQSLNDQLMREAAGRGNTSALALNAARAENEMSGNIAAADAISDAALKGRQFGLDIARTKEGMRLDTERDMANRGYDFLSSNLDRGLGIFRDTEGRRIATEQDLSDRLLNAANTAAGMKYNTGWNVGQMEDSLGRYKINTLGGFMADAENAAANRAAQLSQMNRNNQTTALATRYGQYIPAAQQLGNAFKGVYDEATRQRERGQNFLTDVWKTGNENYRSNVGNYISAFNTGMGNASGAAGGLKPGIGFGDRLMQIAGLGAQWLSAYKK